MQKYRGIKYLNKSYKNVTKCEYLCDTRLKTVMGMAKKNQQTALRVVCC